MPRATDVIDRAEAARILAVHVATVDRMIRKGTLTRGRKNASSQLSRTQVEHVALTTRPVRRLVEAAEDPYWVTRRGAAEILGRSERRVQQLSDADRLPFVTHEGTGWRLYRREQIGVVGNARRRRWPVATERVSPVALGLKPH